MMLGWLDRVSQAGTHLREGSSLESPGVQGERESQWPCKKMGVLKHPSTRTPRGKGSERAHSHPERREAWRVWGRLSPPTH